MTTTAQHRWWAWARVLGGALVIALIARQVGAGPFLDGVRAVDVRTLAAAAAITVLTTACCAWRWRLVAHALQVDLPTASAIAACYRSQFLDATLPGGVLGDVHRGIVRGRDAHALGRGLRSVFWERVIGQIVQIVLTLLILLTLPSPVQRLSASVALVTLVGVVGVVAVGRRFTRHGPAWCVRVRHMVTADLGGISRRAWLGIVVTSGGAVAGYVAIFVLAARAAGTTAPLAVLLPLLTLALVAAALPLNIAGFGPREGVTAWAFAASGLGADQGVAAATAYGVLTLVACTPGAVVLVLDWMRPDARA